MRCSFNPAIPILLVDSVDCLVQIFQTSIIDDHSSSEEIRRFIQTFLSTRLNAVPRSPRPSIAAQPESQDEFGDFDLDIDDPDVIALMGGREVVSYPYEDLDKKAAVVRIAS